MEEAWKRYQQSLSSIVMLDEPKWERLRMAFEEGYKAGREDERNLDADAIENRLEMRRR